LILVENAFVGRFAPVEELTVAMDALRRIANAMAVELCEALGGPHKHRDSR